MNSPSAFCPQCNSNEVDYIVRRDGYVCAKCNHFFKIEKSVEALRIFLSYGHDDKAFIAIKIKEALETMGHEVWYDLERLKCGKDWEEYIQQGLEWVATARSKARFILLMTQHSIRRPDGFCLNELSRAMSMQIAIFPVMVEWCEPPLSICRFQWLDMRQGYQQGKITPKFSEYIRDLASALEYNRNDFEGVLVKLRNILDPIPFESSALMHIRRFVGRAWIKGKIDNWLMKSKERIFWITGSPGAGKSAFASWLHFYHPNVKAFFLCKAPSSGNRGIYEPGDPRWCVRTIAFHLSAMIPEYRNRINAMPLERIVKENSAESMFERIISEALFGINFPSDQSVVILIDGLDELTWEGRNELAEFLVNQLSKTPDFLRVIITSRYEMPLISNLQRYKPFHIDEEIALNEKDQRQFISNEFNRFIENKSLDANIVESLLKKSEGNFLYLEQLRDSLERGHISLDNIKSFPQGLGEFYEHFFNRKFKDVNIFRDRLYDKLAIILAVSTPLRWEEAESLFGWNTGFEIKEFKDFLGALFKYDNNQITPFHASLREWLINEQRAGNFWIRIIDGHKRIAQIGYQAYKSKSDHTVGELKCIQELPVHLLILGELDKLAEFLCDLDIFVTYFGSNIHSYIGYWNSLCREDKNKCWSLTDCPKNLSENLDTCDYLKESNANASEACYSTGRLFFELNEFEHAAIMFQRAVTFLKSNNDDALRGQIHNEIGETFFQMGKIDKAEYHYLRALEIRKRIFNAHPDLAESINNYGHVFYMRGEYENALKYYREALAMWRSLPDGPHYGEADSLNNIACCLDGIGEMEEAKATYEQGANVLDKLRKFNWGIPICRRNYGDLLLRDGYLEEAKRQFRLAYEFSMRIYGPQHESTIQSAIKLAIAHFHMGQHDEALSLFKEIGDTCGKLYGSYDIKTIQTLKLLGEGLIYDGRLDEAKVVFNDVASRIENSENHDRYDKQFLVQLLHKMGEVYLQLGNLDEALKYSLKALKISEEIYPAGHGSIVSTYQLLFKIYADKGDISEVERRIENFKKIHIPKILCDNKLYYESQNLMGRMLRVIGNWSSAEIHYRHVIDCGEKLLKSPEVQLSQKDSRIFNLAVAYNEIAFHHYVPNQCWKDAERFYSRAIELMKSQDNEIELINMQLNFYTVLHMSGKTVDVNDIKMITVKLKKIKDPRAEKGEKILRELKET